MKKQEPIVITKEELRQKRRDWLAVEAFYKGYQVHKSKKDYNRKDKGYLHGHTEEHD